MPYPISSPPLTAATETVALRQQYSFAESPFSGAQVTTSYGFTQWQVTIGFPPVNPTQAKTFMAWLDSLKGQQGSFTYRPVGSGVASVTGKSLSSTAFQTTDAVNVGGFAANGATGLSAGDYCQIGTQFFRIVSVGATANGSGIATVGIEPYVRTTYAAGTPVNFATPEVRLRLAQSEEAPAQSRDPEIWSLPTLNCIEAR